MLLTLLLASVISSGPVQNRQSQETGIATPAGPHVTESRAVESRPAEDLAGTWVYNEAESVDAASGRPETARAAARPGGGTAARSSGSSSSFGATSGSVVQDGLFNLYLARRDTRRDLLEIAPKLHLTVASGALTVTDDLDRALTFPADGSKQKYQLGAALFEARSVWEQDRFVIDIEGPEGLKITETWFVSDDGSRLFLVIRVGDSAREGRLTGVNRVYDRVRSDNALIPGD